MTFFSYCEEKLYCEDVPLIDIAKRYGTPTYVYSRAALEMNISAYLQPEQGRQFAVCYAVKANSNLAILQIAAQSLLGFDIVSVGELERVLKAEGDPQKIIFSGVGKRKDEIARAIDIGIGCFDVESVPELLRLQTIAAEKQKIINVALRINPNIDAQTHPHISTGLNENKFGIYLDEIIAIAEKIRDMPNLSLVGLAFHIGSQLTELSPILQAIDSLQALANELITRGFSLKYLNVGGGLGVVYHKENPPTVKDYLAAIASKFKDSPLDIIIEPGRSLVANAGILLTQIEYIKKTPHKNFIIVDAGMNDLLRPALYDAWHNIQPIIHHSNVDVETYDIVGPVCETADYLGKERKLAIQSHDILAIYSAGAYGSSMSSHYNSRPKAAEVLVDGEQTFLIRERELLEDLWKNETLLSFNG